MDWVNIRSTKNSKGKWKSLFLSGLKVTCKGPPGHGSRFIESTAAEKMVSSLFVSVFCHGETRNLVSWFTVDPIWLVWNTYISLSLTHSLIHWSIHSIPPTCQLRGFFFYNKNSNIALWAQKIIKWDKSNKFEFAWLSFYRVKLSSHLQLLERTKRRGMTEIISKSSERYLYCVLDWVYYV